MATPPRARRGYGDAKSCNLGLYHLKKKGLQYINSVLPSARTGLQLDSELRNDKENKDKKNAIGPPEAAGKRRIPTVPIIRPRLARVCKDENPEDAAPSVPVVPAEKRKKRKPNPPPLDPRDINVILKKVNTLRRRNKPLSPAVKQLAKRFRRSESHMYAVIKKAEGNEGKPISDVFKVREAERSTS